MRRRTVVITDSDMQQLRRLIASGDRSFRGESLQLQRLEEELDCAEIVNSEEVLPDLVTMNSRVQVRHLDSGVASEFQLVLPQNANLNYHRISVLAPLGAALLGHREGDVVECDAPSGKKRVRVKKIVYQPRAGKLAA